jgi:hypothetical protein
VAEPALHVWVRTAIDWSDEPAVLAQMSPSMRAKVATWDATLSLPYHVFRHRVCEIARLNLAALADIVITDWDDIPDGALVVPVDDDDWFAPDLAAALHAARRDGAAGYLWPSSFIEVPVDRTHIVGVARRRLIPGTRPRYVCTTNNYALHRTPETQDLARSHVRASRWVDADPQRFVRLEQHLSAMNRTLASQTTLGLRRAAISPARLRAKLRRYRRLYHRPLPAELGWCEPYVARMATLMDELSTREGRS